MEPAPVLDPLEMRRVLGAFATGVVVVTGEAGGEPLGFACQSFASVSLEPPLVLFCPARTSMSWQRIAPSGRFAINVLAADQQEVSATFGRSGGDKFAGIAWTPTPWGPSLDGTLASVMCDVEAVHPGGDHDIVVGRVRSLELHRDGAPLLFFRGSYELSGG